MSVTAYHLRFTAPLHPGVEGIGQEKIEQTVRSDTLWGALVQCWALLFPENPEKLAHTCPFTVSSCFPIIKGRRYYPVPLGALDRFFSDEEHFDAKTLKRVNFLSELLFFAWLKGQSFSRADLTMHGNLLPPIDKEAEALRRKNERLDYSIAAQRPRLQVSRLTGGAEEGLLYYANDLHFNHTIDAGLFFLARFDGDAQTRFDAALGLLGDTGLGADRTIGRGTFTFTATQLELPKIIEPSGQVLLSLVHPTEGEIRAGLLQNSTYHLIKRIGYAAAPGVAGKRRPDLWMLAEGSVLRQPTVGGIPEVIPASVGIHHPVFRYGRAFSIPYTIQEG